MNTFIFIDLDLVEWDGTGELPVPHLNAMKFSKFLTLKGNRTDLIYKKEQLHLLESYDFIIVCSREERLIPDYLIKFSNKKILTFDSELDYQIKYGGIDDGLYAEMIQEFLFEKNYSVDRLMWHSSASLIKLSSDEEIINMVDDVYERSKNYICIYDRDFLSLNGWQQIISELEEKQKKYRFAFPLNIDSLEDIDDVILLQETKFMFKTDFILYQPINNEIKKYMLELNKFKTQTYIFNAPNFNLKNDIEYWLKIFKFCFNMYFEIRYLGGECKINITQIPNINKIILDVFLEAISFMNKNYFDISFDDFLRIGANLPKKGKSKKIIDYEFFNYLFNDLDFNFFFNRKIDKNRQYY